MGDNGEMSLVRSANKKEHHLMLFFVSCNLVKSFLNDSPLQ